MLKEEKEGVPAWYIGNISFDKHLLRNLRGDGLTIRIICGLCMISGRYVYQNTAHLNTIYKTVFRVVPEHSSMAGRLDFIQVDPLFCIPVSNSPAHAFEL